MWEWVIGLSFSIIVGGIFVEIFLRVLRSRLGKKPKLHGSPKGVPGWLTGGIERLFFTVVAALALPGAPTAMAGWLALKLATNWNHPDWKNKPEARTHAFSALLGGLISMFFSFLGALVCIGKIPLCI